MFTITDFIISGQYYFNSFNEYIIGTFVRDTYITHWEVLQLVVWWWVAIANLQFWKNFKIVMGRKESKLRWREMKQSEDKRDSAIVLEKSVNLSLLKTPKIPRPPTYSIVSFIWGSHPESFWLLRILLSASCLSPEFY